MDEDIYDEEENYAEGEEVEDEESDEDSFMEGYSDDDKVEECAECGIALNEKNKLEREVQGEKFMFCSKTCADEFEESVKTE